MNAKRRPLLLLLALAALLALGAGAWAESYKAVVTADSMSVYSTQSPHGYLGSLPKGTEVTVEQTSGSAALISYKGHQGLVMLSDLSAAQTPEPTQAPSQSTPVVTLRKTRVYRKPSTKSSYTTVPAGTAMNLLDVNGQVAKVSLNGNTGYVVYSHLGAAEPDPTPTPAPSQDPEVQTGNAPVVANRTTRLYANPSTDSSYITVQKGTAMTLLAIKGECAMVELDGAIGYTAVSHLSKASDNPGGQNTSPSAANPFAEGSNERVIYAFLIGEMNLNRAAAMGIMANIKYESSYRPDCNGDGGTSYGICQWHAGRKTRLINWCGENGLDYTTLEGQLRYLKYELPTFYPTVYNYVRQVENTADGAYDAGYYFCFNFEAPAARTSQSTARGNYAKNTLWPKK